MRERWTSPALDVRLSSCARVRRSSPEGWRLCVPSGLRGRYRLAQLDDYGDRKRRDFPWSPPLHVKLRARISTANQPGTWGFGLWNDPFGAPMGLGGAEHWLPALPNAAWFFHASPPNYLALRDDHPAQGFLAATFHSPAIPPPLLGLGLPLLPLLSCPPVAKTLRRAGRRLVSEDAALVAVDPSGWHTYGLIWLETGVRFDVDGAVCFSTSVSPLGPLGLVVWIDNQYMTFSPEGRLRFGTLSNSAACLAVHDVRVRSADRGTLL